MSRTLANFMRRQPLLPLVFTLVAALGGAPHTALAQPSVSADLRMAQEAEPLRRVADSFVARALAGDAAGVRAMLSTALVERAGEAGVMRALQGQILPFFAQGHGPGRSVTITRTTDASGSQGFAFYMWLLPAQGGEPRPFTVYTVVEQGRAVVANIVPDRLVPGRHQ
jgi:hypothetical protein